MHDKVILTDCDGVLCDWEYGFEQFMKGHGYEKERSDTYDLREQYGFTDETFGKFQESEKRIFARWFNESTRIETLAPFRDAVHYVKKLHEEQGYVFHVITSLSLEEGAWNARMRNLEKLFGPTAIERLVCLDTGADKDDALIEYKDTGCVWVEDKPSNAELGVRMGLDTILIDHVHNRDFDEGEDIKRVKTWKEIYEHVVWGD